MFTGFVSQYTGFMLMAVGWGLIMLFNLVTLPVEFDASTRAKRVLAELGFIGTDEEMVGVRKTLGRPATEDDLDPKQWSRSSFVRPAGRGGTCCGPCYPVLQSGRI